MCSNMTQQYRGTLVELTLSQIEHAFKDESLEDWVQGAMQHHCSMPEYVSFYNRTVLDGVAYEEPSFFYEVWHQPGLVNFPDDESFLERLSSDRDRIRSIVAMGHVAHFYLEYFHKADIPLEYCGPLLSHIAHYISHTTHPYCTPRVRYAPFIDGAASYLGIANVGAIVALDVLTTAYDKWAVANLDTIDEIRRISSDAVDPLLLRPYELPVYRLLDTLFLYLDAI